VCFGAPRAGGYKWQYTLITAFPSCLYSENDVVVHNLFVTDDQMSLISGLRLWWIADQLYCTFHKVIFVINYRYHRLSIGSILMQLFSQFAGSQN